VSVRHRAIDTLKQNLEDEEFMSDWITDNASFKVGTNPSGFLCSISCSTNSFYINSIYGLDKIVNKQELSNAYHKCTGNFKDQLT
jgi:hypothetical protein